MEFGLYEENIINSFKERKSNLIYAVNRLKKALNEPEEDIAIDCAFHRYKITFELAWKTLKDYLEYLGISSNTGSPREVLKESYAHNLIDNGDIWINMMLARNSLSHLYDEEESRKIYNDIKNKYIFEIEKLVKFIEYK